jgi:xanthine dehydrogenase accessory factor
MMEWLESLTDWLASELAVVLVTVVQVKGSAPREAGTSFVVSSERTAGTIGGGRLEWEAIKESRHMLATPSAPLLRRFALCPSLGQCCGGVVWLLFERIGAEHKSAWDERLAAARDGACLWREAASDQPCSSWSSITNNDRCVPGAELHLDGAQWRFCQTCGEARFPVVVFGAGHVGAALVRTLAPVGAQITWIDSRENVIPDALPRNVNARWIETPEDAVDAAPRGAYFLVLTHSHDLDLVLCERILRRSDFAYLGLVGSRSKRARFEHRLAARGIEAARIAEMVCPIGIAGIGAKTPATIAVAVAAQLLQRFSCH